MPAKKTKEKKSCDCTECHCGSTGGFVYILGFIGSAIYYISHADSFWTGVLGFLKAVAWPVFLVYELLNFIGA